MGVHFRHKKVNMIRWTCFDSWHMGPIKVFHVKLLTYSCEHDWHHMWLHSHMCLVQLRYSWIAFAIQHISIWHINEINLTYGWYLFDIWLKKFGISPKLIMSKWWESYVKISDNMSKVQDTYVKKVTYVQCLFWHVKVCLT